MTTEHAVSKQYKVTGRSGVETYLELIHENHEGYDIRITSISENAVKESEEFISRHLLEACIRTGYLTECARMASSLSA